jgi:alanine-glyoxylate transaminase/serine-glyoxylate transaminase/serine-pyruvate transaminase
MTPYTDLNTPERLLLGPGPSMVHPRVLSVMSHPLVGHLDPSFVKLMNEVQDMLRLRLPMTPSADISATFTE